MSLNNIVSACGAVGSAVVGGVYANFSARVMHWLDSLPDAEAIETMQKFNRTAVQVPFTTFFFGTAIASAWTVVHNLRKKDRVIGDQISAAGGVLYLAGWVLTIVYNVPRNNRLADVVAGLLKGPGFGTSPWTKGPPQTGCEPFSHSWVLWDWALELP